MAKKETNWISFGLKFVGGLVYLYVLKAFWDLWKGQAVPVPTFLNVGSGTLLQSALFGLGAVCALTLLIVTLASPMMRSKRIADISFKAEIYAAFALFTLAAVGMNKMLGVVAAIGFLMAYVGSGLEEKA